MCEQEQTVCHPSFVERLRAGDNDAWTLFYQRYKRRIRNYLAARISRSGWRRRAGSDDLWGSLVGSLLRRLKRDQEKLDIDKMTEFLMGMAKNKWLAANAREYAIKRSPRREVTGSSVVDALAEPAPTPSQIAAAREEAGILRKNMAQACEEYIRAAEPKDDLDRVILEMRFVGYSTKQIATQIAMSQRTVQLRLQQMTYRAFFNRLDSVDHQIIELDLQGHSAKDIAKTLERAQSAVEHRFEKIDYLLTSPMLEE